jgi:N-acetylneuraminic acid mutarotase
MVMLIIVAMVLPALNYHSSKAAQEESSWTSASPMPTARGELGVAVVNGKIYAIGGLSGDLPVGNNEEYDPVTNQWTEKMPMTMARSGFAVAVYDNKIYVIGGTIGNWYVGNNEAYNPATNMWETKASMPTPRSDLMASIVNDKIYLIGGKKYSSTTPYFTETNVNEVYDPANDSWSTKAPIPSPVYGYASAVANNLIYIVGGSKNSVSPGSNVFVDSNQVYDPLTDKWSLAANLPSTAAYGASASTQGYMAPSKIYFIGGYFLNSFSSKTQVFDPDKNTWSAGTSMPTSRAYLGVTVVNDVLYAIGGFDGTNWLKTNEQYKPVGYGTVPPEVQITSPENKTYSEVALTFAINRGAEWIGYSIDSQPNVTITGETNLFNLSQGEHSVIIYANDSLGNMGSSETVFFSVDMLAPDISIIVPQNQTYGSTDIPLTLIINKSTSWLAYSLDKKENVTIIGNVTLPALPNGPHSLTVYAIDELGNSGSETVSFDIEPFPMIMATAIVATITIILAAGYLYLKRQQPSNSKK